MHTTLGQASADTARTSGGRHCVVLCSMAIRFLLGLTSPCDGHEHGMAKRSFWVGKMLKQAWRRVGYASRLARSYEDFEVSVFYNNVSFFVCLRLCRWHPQIMQKVEESTIATTPPCSWQECISFCGVFNLLRLPCEEQT